jgi:hypothetical protein
LYSTKRTYRVWFDVYRGMLLECRVKTKQQEYVL